MSWLFNMMFLFSSLFSFLFLVSFSKLNLVSSNEVKIKSFQFMSMV